MATDPQLYGGTMDDLAALFSFPRGLKLREELTQPSLRAPSGFRVATGPPSMQRIHAATLTRCSSSPWMRSRRSSTSPPPSKASRAQPVVQDLSASVGFDGRAAAFHPPRRWNESPCSAFIRVHRPRFVGLPFTVMFYANEQENDSWGSNLNDVPAEDLMNWNIEFIKIHQGFYFHHNKRLYVRCMEKRRDVANK